MEAEVAAAKVAAPGPAVPLPLLLPPSLPPDVMRPSYHMVTHAGSTCANASEVWKAINYIVMSMWVFGEYEPAPVLLIGRIIAFELMADAFWLHGLEALDALSMEPITWPEEQPRRWRLQLHFPNSKTPKELPKIFRRDRHNPQG